MNKDKMKKQLLLNPLCEAVAHDEYYSFSALIQQKDIDIDGRDYNNVTPLYYAALFKNTYMAKVLLEHGANIEIRDEFGNTPLMKACLNRDAEMINLLISYGADINATNNYGHSPKEMSRTIMDFPEIEALKK